MAGDWIKMRVDLADDPAVISMAAQLAVSEHTIVGALHKFWSWADKHTRDGNAKGVTHSWINRYIMLPDFAQSMVSVGWLVDSEAGISIPNFEKHNGETGKKRAETKKRVDKHRHGEPEHVTQKTEICNAEIVTNALPEKRREEKKENKGAGFVLPDWVPLKSWAAYLEMRKKARKAPTDHAMDLVVRELEKLRTNGEDVARVLDQSTMRNWTDVYAVKDKGAAPADPFRGAI